MYSSDYSKLTVLLGYFSIKDKMSIPLFQNLSNVLNRFQCKNKVNRLERTEILYTPIFSN